MKDPFGQGITSGDRVRDPSLYASTSSVRRCLWPTDTARDRFPELPEMYDREMDPERTRTSLALPPDAHLRRRALGEGPRESMYITPIRGVLMSPELRYEPPDPYDIAVGGPSPWGGVTPYASRYYDPLLRTIERRRGRGRFEEDTEDLQRLNEVSNMFHSTEAAF
ncbi:hypothetical protein NDU88_000413 [Pleurodeles waltl]|uniref:Uncharacterized protein n=1 Tax=Pleurodeles waltl TaxID=8319 RepID=A0AAV7VTE3_PLEWA|nr:hypothetical protein NDU88_000413 [Pleurodeles waltl]